MAKRMKEAYVPDPVRSISPWKNGYLAARELEGNYSVVELGEDLSIVRTLFRRNDLPGRTPFSCTACPQDPNLLAVMTLKDAAPRPDFVIYDWAEKKVVDILPMTFGGAWSKKKKVFYFATTEQDGDISRTVIKCYDAQAGGLTDVKAFEGNSIFGHVNLSENGDYIMLSFSVDYSRDVFYALHEQSGRINPINEGKPEKLTYIDTADDRHYFISLEESDHGTLICIPDGKPAGEAQTVYCEKEGFMDSGFAFGGRIFVHIQNCAASTVKAMPGGEIIRLPAEIGALTQEGEGNKVRFFLFDCFTQKPQILSFDGVQFKTVLKTGEEQKKDLSGKMAEEDTDQSAFPEKEKPDELVTELLFAKSTEDQTKIPYYLVRRRDAVKNRLNPVLMYGYGGYNISMPPWSKEMVTGTDIPAWVRDGGIYVHCLLRGGNEYGPAWHEAGMGLHKKNCYADFIGIAEKIISAGWTSRKEFRRHAAGEKYGGCSHSFKGT